MGSDHCPILLELDRDIGDSNKDCDQAVMLPRAIKVYAKSFMLLESPLNYPSSARSGIDTVLPPSDKESQDQLTRKY